MPDKLESDEPFDSAASKATPGAPSGATTSGRSPTIPMDVSAIVLPAESDGVTAHEQKARLAEARLAQVLDAYRQLKADQEAFKERTARTVSRRFESRHERLLLKFIEILDNFDRALEASEQTYAGQPLIEGLILVRTQLLQTLQQEGLERIPVLGLAFDPAVSEAMGSEPVEDPDQNGLVVKEYQRGYRINGRLARPSRVVVGRYAEAADEAAGAPAAPAEPERAPEESPGASPQAPGLAAYDYPEPLRPIGEDEPDEVPCTAADEGKVGPTPVDEEGPTLEEIIARAEAQRALFGEAFEEESDESRSGTDDKESEP